MTDVPSDNSRYVAEADVRSSLAAVVRRLDELEAERADLDRRRGVLQGLVSVFDDVDLVDVVKRSDRIAERPVWHMGRTSVDVEAIPEPRSAEGRQVSQRQRILEVMWLSREVMTPIEIADELERTFGLKAHRTTISSQLQKLRDRNLVEKVEGVEGGWRAVGVEDGAGGWRAVGVEDGAGVGAKLEEDS